MKTIKPSIFLAALAWVSVFGISWLMVMRVIFLDLVNWLFLGLFFVVAVFSSAMYAPRSTPKE